MTELMTQEQYYDAYLTTNEQLKATRQHLKDLRVAGEKAAQKTRRETIGTVQEKIAAIEATWKPFKAQIAQTEVDIKRLEGDFDFYEDRWHGIENPRECYYR